MTTRPMQCQREAARFASRPDDGAEQQIRRSTNEAALKCLRERGDVDAALEAMYAGLALQAPLSFKRPVVTL